jgi:hypothetical protein
MVDQSLISVSFFSYLWHDQLTDLDSSDFPEVIAGNRFDFIGSSYLPMAFFRDPLSALSNEVVPTDRSRINLATEYGGPSFNCTNATTEDEIAICQDPILAAQDLLYSRLYVQMRAGLGANADTSRARSILRERTSCRSNAGCIGSVQRRAITWIAPQLPEMDLPEWYVFLGKQ